LKRKKSNRQSRENAQQTNMQKEENGISHNFIRRSFQAHSTAFINWAPLAVYRDAVIGNVIKGDVRSKFFGRHKSF
jgi:hypothetical protein